MFWDYMQHVSVQQLVEPCEQNISVPAAITLVDDLNSLPTGFIFQLNSTCRNGGYLYDQYTEELLQVKQ